MRTFDVTLRITYDPGSSEEPSKWNWAELLLIEGEESVEVLNVTEVK